MKYIKYAILIIGAIYGSFMIFSYIGTAIGLGAAGTGVGATTVAAETAAVAAETATAAAAAAAAVAAETAAAATAAAVKAVAVVGTAAAPAAAASAASTAATAVATAAVAGAATATATATATTAGATTAAAAGAGATAGAGAGGFWLGVQSIFTKILFMFNSAVVGATAISTMDEYMDLSLPEKLKSAGNCVWAQEPPSSTPLVHSPIMTCVGLKLAIFVLVENLIHWVDVGKVPTDKDIDLLRKMGPQLLTKALKGIAIFDEGEERSKGWEKKIGAIATEAEAPTAAQIFVYSVIKMIRGEKKKKWRRGPKSSSGEEIWAKQWSSVKKWHSAVKDSFTVKNLRMETWMEAGAGYLLGDFSGRGREEKKMVTYYIASYRQTKPRELLDNTFNAVKRNNASITINTRNQRAKEMIQSEREIEDDFQNNRTAVTPIIVLAWFLAVMDQDPDFKNAPPITGDFSSPPIGYKIINNRFTITQTPNLSQYLRHLLYDAPTIDSCAELTTSLPETDEAQKRKAQKHLYTLPDTARCVWKGLMKKVMERHRQMDMNILVVPPMPATLELLGKYYFWEAEGKIDQWPVSMTRQELDAAIKLIRVEEGEVLPGVFQPAVSSRANEKDVVAVSKAERRLAKKLKTELETHVQARRDSAWEKEKEKEEEAALEQFNRNYKQVLLDDPQKILGVVRDLGRTAASASDTASTKLAQFIQGENDSELAQKIIEAIPPTTSQSAEKYKERMEKWGANEFKKFFIPAILKRKEVTSPSTQHTTSPSSSSSSPSYKTMGDTEQEHELYQLLLSGGAGDYMRKIGPSAPLPTGADANKLIRHIAFHIGYTKTQGSTLWATPELGQQIYNMVKPGKIDEVKKMIVKYYREYETSDQTKKLAASEAVVKLFKAKQKGGVHYRRKHKTRKRGRKRKNKQTRKKYRPKPKKRRRRRRRRKKKRRKSTLNCKKIIRFKHKSTRKRGGHKRRYTRKLSKK